MSYGFPRVIGLTLTHLPSATGCCCLPVVSYRRCLLQEDRYSPPDHSSIRTFVTSVAGGKLRKLCEVSHSCTVDK